MALQVLYSFIKKVRPPAVLIYFRQFYSKNNWLSRFICVGLCMGLCLLVLPVLAKPQRQKKPTHFHKAVVHQSKVLPSHLQKAYVVQKAAIVYARPEFDSLKITTIPNGTVVTVSRKIYRPKSLFGTFYRIYIAKPKKMRAYISEIDVVPHYIKVGNRYKLNPEFKNAKNKIDYVRTFEAHNPSADKLDFGESTISELKWIGMTVSHAWIAYAPENTAVVPSWFANINIGGAGVIIPNFSTNMNIGLSLTAPVINGQRVRKGYVVLGDFVLMAPIVEAPHFLVNVGGGLMAKAKGTRLPDTPRLEVGAGMVGHVGLMFRVQDRLSVLLSSQYYYDLQENRSFFSLAGGLLVAF